MRLLNVVSLYSFTYGVFKDKFYCFSYVSVWVCAHVKADVGGGQRHQLLLNWSYKRLLAT